MPPSKYVDTVEVDEQRLFKIKQIQEELYREKIFFRSTQDDEIMPAQLRDVVQAGREESRPSEATDRNTE